MLNDDGGQISYTGSPIWVSCPTSNSLPPLPPAENECGLDDPEEDALLCSQMEISERSQQSSFSYGYPVDHTIIAAPLPELGLPTEAATNPHNVQQVIPVISLTDALIHGRGMNSMMLLPFPKFYIYISFLY